MQYVKLGSAGLRISRLGLGMMSYGDPNWRPWILDEASSAAIVRQAAELGITFYDTADAYSDGASEEVTGRLLKRTFSRREDYVVATKVHHPMGDGPNDRGLSRGHILDAVDASLRRLDLDHIDLYQIHRWDPTVPIEETMHALDDVVRAGKVRYLGASNTNAWQFMKAQAAAQHNGWTGFVSMQNHYNLLHRPDEAELIPMLLDQGAASIPFCPLARGVLARAGTGAETTGQRYETDDSAVRAYGEPDEQVLNRVATIADQRGVAPAQIALAWLLHQPVVAAPIVGATKPAHLAAAAAAVDTELTPAELQLLDNVDL